MPVGSVQGQNPTQGLVHWMSAVMAEHMTSSNTHHDPTVGMHYMWNGGVDVSEPFFRCVLSRRLLSLSIPRQKERTYFYIEDAIVLKVIGRVVRAAPLSLSHIEEWETSFFIRT